MDSDLTTTEGEESASRRNLVIFRLNGQAYSLPIEQVEQIIPMVAITRIPQVGETVEGVINVRGTAVPVVDLRRHLGLANPILQLHTPIILARINGLPVGLVVDEVVDVFMLFEGQISRPGDFLPESLGEVPVLQGLTYAPGEAVLLLDPEKLFSPRQAEALAHAAELLPGLAEEDGPPYKPQGEGEPEDE